MICEKCKEEGTTSTIRSLGGSSTLMGFSSYYDEGGVYHRHDPNRRKFLYSCSNGHDFYVSNLIDCPNCDFSKDSEVVEFFAH